MTVHYPLATEGEILAAFRRNDLSAVAEGLEKLSDYTLSHAAGPNTIRSFYLQLYCAMQKCMMELGLAPDLLRPFGHEQLIGLHSMQEMNLLMLGIFTTLMDHMSRRTEQQPAETLRQICAYIDGHLEEDLSIERLAERFGISASYMHRLFRAETQGTAKAYIDARRVEKAKALLAGSRMQVQEIARAVGFLSAQSFVKFFKGAVGITPGEYRNQTSHTRGHEGPT